MVFVAFYSLSLSKMMVIVQLQIKILVAALSGL